MVYCFGDPHFGHKNVIQFEKRPFPSVEAMDEAIIARWNATVAGDDMVYLLGDFSFYGADKTYAIARRLRGRKRLIIGNHDRRTLSAYAAMGFERVWDTPILIEGRILLSHEPVMAIHGDPTSPLVNIYAHVHGHPDFADYTANTFCASAERLDYTPVSLDHIKGLLGLELDRGDAQS